MIPKVIHYCWFGGAPLPEKERKCLENWKKFCPDYEIIRWDESNYDVSVCPYMQQAYDCKKWGFVPDYARLDIIYRHGGIYLDADVELLKSLDPLLTHAAFMGRESAFRIGPGLGFGAEPGHPFLRKNRDLYQNLPFLRLDGTMNLTPSSQYTTELLLAEGLSPEDRLDEIAGVTIYPTVFFSPIQYATGLGAPTEQTYSIHWFSASWFEPEAKANLLATRRAYKRFGPRFGKFVCKARGALRLLKKGEYGTVLKKLLGGKAYARLRRLYLLRHRGHAFTCPCCGNHLRRFVDYAYQKNGEKRDARRYPHSYRETICPFCGSLPRHRILCEALSQNQELLQGKKVVLFSVESPTMQFLWQRGIPFQTVDLYDPKADLRMNIQRLEFPNESLGFIVCNNVLEHVGDDKAALRELHRVLEPGGLLVLTVPIDPSYPHTVEDASVVDPYLRVQRFGQIDHLRIFGTDFVDEVLRAVMQPDGSPGFAITELRGDTMRGEIRAVTGPADYDGNVLFFCRKL